jgi:transcriptional regulator with XRE-family HTH domain
MERLPEGVPTPNEWLAQVVEERGISRRSLATMIGVEATRIQRWISGREPIPRYHLAEIARQIGSPGDEGYVLRLKDCEDLADQISKRAAELARHTRNMTGKQIEGAVLRRVGNLLSQETGVSLYGRAEVLTRHLVDAHFAMQSWLQTVEQDYNPRSPLFFPITVARHLQYPVNHFVGVLLDLDAFREGGLINIHRLVEKEGVRNQADQLVRQHAIHMLARHGSATDRDFIKEILQQESASQDLMMKRLGFVGLLLVESDPEVMGQFLAELERNPKLATVNTLFDAVHYGDIHVEAKDGIPDAYSEFTRAIPHILRHLEQPRQYQNILALELQKLLHILEKVGPKPFLRPQILRRLANILLQLNGVEIPLDELGVLRRAFIQSFGEVLDIGRRRGIFNPAK